MTDTVFVSALVLHAHHGVNEHETRIGQPFILDLALTVDLADASRSDRLADTMSYDDIIETTRRAFVGRNYKLVEAAAGAVADALLAAFPRVGQVFVTVRKPHAPIAAVFDDVGVTLRRARRG